MIVARKILTPFTIACLLSLTGCNLMPLKHDQHVAANPTAVEKPSMTVSTAPAPAIPATVTLQEIGDTDRTVKQVEALQLTAASAEPESQTDTDLWARVRAGYQMQVPDNARVKQSIKWYASHGKYLQRMQLRATPYLHFIVEEIEKRQMPMEMALLPVVESAFNPFAYSPGRAAGIWQFIPSTGKAYGLKQNWWYDGRRDIVAATRAALDYLDALAKRFDGDWELALASYNAGAGTVRRAIRKNRKRGKATDYWSLDLPRETEGYVPKLLAMASIIAHPDQHNITLTPIANTPYFGSVDIESQLDLALAAEMAELSIEELYKLNPGFNRWASPPEGPHRLNLPLEKIDGFTDKLAELDPLKRLRWKRYRIRSGDSLSVISERHGTTITQLRQVNKIKGNNIRAGKHLLIPISSEQPAHYSFSAEQRTAKIQSSKRKGKKVVYKVKQGDSFWSIANKHKVSHKSLARWNGLSPRDTLRQGQKLSIWIKERKNSSGDRAVAGAIPGTTALPFSTRSSINYRVRKGDSLARIAQRFKITVADLRKWNTLASRYLQPGQRLKLYVDVTEQSL
ncbi:MAG: LysM peptidoglycan-binding domain-containing protein [Candidatus Sedimenticola sp. (ex Thyasira tokunagai)]